MPQKQSPFAQNGRMERPSETREYRKSTWYSIISIWVLSFTKETLLVMLFIDLLLNSYELKLYPLLWVATLIVFNENKQTDTPHFQINVFITTLPDDFPLYIISNGILFFQISIRQHLTSLSQDRMRRRVNEGSFYLLKPFL